MAPLKEKSRICVLLGLPESLLVIGFGAAIIPGALLLRVPWAQQGGRVNFLDALFTSAPAVCVTGLAVVNPGSDFTRFGQIVIMLLIQTGGLEIMRW